MGEDNRYVIGRKTFSSHLLEMSKELFKEELFTDVTLVSDDMLPVKAHRTVLYAASPVFKQLLTMQQGNPLLYVKGSTEGELRSMLEFIYLGETQVKEEHLDSFMKLGEHFQIKDLFKSGVSSENIENIAETEPEQVKASEEETEKDEQTDEEENIELECEIKPEKLLFDDSGDPLDMSFTCVRCEKKFSRKGNLKQHFDGVHGGKEKLGCDMCKFKTTRKNDLRRHMEKHSESSRN